MIHSVIGRLKKESSPERHDQHQEQEHHEGHEGNSDKMNLLRVLRVLRGESFLRSVSRCVGTVDEP